MRNKIGYTFCGVCRCSRIWINSGIHRWSFSEPEDLKSRKIWKEPNHINTTVSREENTLEKLIIWNLFWQLPLTYNITSCTKQHSYLEFLVCFISQNREAIFTSDLPSFTQPRRRKNLCLSSQFVFNWIAPNYLLRWSPSFLLLLL